MPDKIILSKDEVVVFMGTMNGFPMMYALELKKLGYEVIYFVDVPQKNTLSRPENHFPGIQYPYPSWVVEFILPSQLLLALFPRLFSALYLRMIKQRTPKKVGGVFLNGFFTSLAPYLPNVTYKLGLSHGSDLDVWADLEGADKLATSFDRSIFKHLPQFISKKLIKHIVNVQFRGYASLYAALYFPMGFNAVGDRVLRQLMAFGVRHIPRFEISFEPLLNESRAFKAASEKIVIFSGVRFLFKTFPDGNTGYNKGNDLIIEGIAKYYAINKNICVHFVEKGEDVEFAKALCQKLGLEQVVVWHKEMPFKDLLGLYQASDICFDQLGEHWLGAIGCYALWLGKPLITNMAFASRVVRWPQENPVCAAKTAEEVYGWLVRLEDVGFRKTVSDRSKLFAEQYLAFGNVLSDLFAR